jgi:subtilisin family serine protease
VKFFNPPFYLACCIGLVLSGTISGQQNQALNDHTALRTIHILLEDQFDVRAFRDSILRSNIPLANRPELVIKRLQGIAKPAQNQIGALIREFEKKKPGSALNLRGNFIVNVMVLEASQPLLDYLAQSGLVKEFIEKEQWSPVYQAPIHRSPDVARQVGGREPGLEVIKAPFLWNLGYTGAGSTIYTIDTGVWTNHPAIKRQWSGNFFPVDWCWKSYDRPDPGDKSDSHGTHVTGTSLGLDTTTKDTIGVAFNARFIASDPIAESIAGIKPIEVLIGAFEFALNPDGDIATADDVPDVVTNSWGIPFYEPSLCAAPLVENMFMALEAAGIAVEFSAGNEGPDPETISLPQYISIDTLTVFSVGAVNATNVNGPFPITDFSSRGPSKCIGSGENPSLRIKPEVVAPGFAVRSSVGQNQYSFYSGTSMAGPHVSGGVALLKEAFPQVSGREILNALYQSATDLGPAGEDNAYGRGLINLEAAYHFLASRYEVKPPNDSPYDLVLEQILAPASLCTGATTVNVVLHNSGTLPLNATKIILRNNLIQVLEKNLSLTLKPGERDTIEIPGIELNSRNHELFATVYADSLIAERNLVNNNCTRRFSVSLVRSLPYKEDFENVSVTGSDRLLLNPDQQISWDTISTAGLPDSRRSAHMRFIGYTPRIGQIDEIRLPRLFIPAGANRLNFRFDYAYRYRNGYRDSLKVELSTDCGITWPYRVFASGGKALATTDTSWSQFVPQMPSHWDSLHVQLDSLIPSGNISIRFRSINYGGSRLYIDNIHVYTDVSAQDTIFPDWEIFPNPVSDLLYVSSLNPLQNARLFISDLNGRIVFETYIAQGSTLIEIPMGKLAAGLYFVSLDSNRGRLVRKFIRQ